MHVPGLSLLCLSLASSSGMSVHTVLQPVGAGGDVSCGTHPNGFWEVRLENSSPTAFEALETALGKTAAAEAHGVVLTARDTM